MKSICVLEDCTGCMSCLNSCPHNAIFLKEDVCGFRYPYIDSDFCIDCNLCVKSCPVNNHQDKKFPSACYAAVANLDSIELQDCASGGVASAFSYFVLKGGGVVYGCSGQDPYHVRHRRITNIDEVPLLQNSKYVQSEIGKILVDVKRDLKRGVLTLFIGTPCQVSGLKSFLKHEYENLLTIDLCCHGVPSQKLLNDNIHYYYQSTKENIDITSLRFRRKVMPKVRTQSVKIEYGCFFQKKHPYSKDYIKKYVHDPYMFGFLSGLFYRESCYRCLYAYSIRVGDITLSDFWGLGKDSKMYNERGVSAVLINTGKGDSFFEELKPLLEFEKREIREAIMGNGQFQHPSRRHPNYLLFRELYPKYGLRYASRQCLKNDLVKYYANLFIHKIWHLIK